MKNDIDKEYYLTRGQYAQKINKTKGAVIQSMRRGGLKDEYIVRDGKYYFRDYHVGLRANKKVNMYQCIHLRKNIIVATMITPTILMLL